MELRPYHPADCPRLAALFRATVQTLNASDYTQLQLDAWTSGADDLNAWYRTFAFHIAFVAWEGEEIVGFGDIDASGYLDRLFVHKDRQSQGIGTALCDALENAVEAPVLTTAASLTARPFFEGRGYRVVRAQQVERQGIFLGNFWMYKEKFSHSSEKSAKKSLQIPSALL